MVLPRIREVFARVPEELVGLCRPHAWQDLTTASPGAAFSLSP